MMAKIKMMMIMMMMMSLPTEIRHVECKNRSDITNNRGNWNSLKIVQKIRAPLTGKAQNQRTANNSHIGHCAYILFSSY
jgi:hypothetical protein